MERRNVTPRFRGRARRWVLPRWPASDLPPHAVSLLQGLGQPPGPEAVADLGARHAQPAHCSSQGVEDGCLDPDFPSERRHDFFGEAGQLLLEERARHPHRRREHDVLQPGVFFLHRFEMRLRLLGRSTQPDALG